MSFRGRGAPRGGSSFRGGDRGGFRGGRGGFGGGRGKPINLSFKFTIGYDQGPPEYVEAVVEFSHACEGMLICYITNDQVPLLMRSIYLENKNKIGKVDDVFGPMSKCGIAIKPDDGVKAESFKAGDKVSKYY